MADKRVAILFSGRGSNMIALLRAMQNTPDFGAIPAVLITDNPKAGGIEYARELGFECHVIDGAGYKDKDSFDIELDKVLKSARVDFVCLAGFMRILGANIVDKWVGQILNIHPSLLPKYRGLNTHKRAIDAGEKVAGASVHLVNKIVDGGKVLDREIVEITKNDTEKTLAERVLVKEHHLYPLILKEVIDGSFDKVLENEKTLFDTQFGTRFG